MPSAGTEAPFARTVPTPGVEQTIRFVAGPGGDIFCSVHVPTGGARATIVLCPPLLADHSFSYRRELLLAQELAARGIAVWRFHYSGTGHSEGAPEAVSFDTLVADAMFIVDLASSSTSAPVTIGGTRCGAMVAAAVTGDRPVVLWEAATDGGAYLNEGFRARMIADGGQLQRTPPTSDQLLVELRDTGRTELVGYSLYERLHDSLAGRRLVEQFTARGVRVLLIDGQAPDGSEPPDALAQALVHLGQHVTNATVGVAEGWWFHRTQQSDHAALARDLAGVIASWVPRAGEPAAVSLPPTTNGRTCDFIEVGEGAVFAMLTPPTGPPRGEAALLLWGGGGMPAFGRNQVGTAMARRLAGRGYHVLQLDYPGRGDSPGAEPPDPIDEPAKLEVFAAARAAYGWLRARGLPPVVAVGSCQGAVAALNTAAAAPSLTGLALLAPLIAERFEGMTAYGQPLEVSPMHPRVRDSFEAVVQAGTPLLIAYGVHDEGYPSFHRALEGELGRALRRAGDRATLVTTDERIHGYMTVSGQEATVDIVMGWMDRLRL